MKRKNVQQKHKSAESTNGVESRKTSDPNVFQSNLSGTFIKKKKKKS